jgi:hypothetical protein
MVSFKFDQETEEKPNRYRYTLDTHCGKDKMLYSFINIQRLPLKM